MGHHVAGRAGFSGGSSALNGGRPYGKHASGGAQQRAVTLIVLRTGTCLIHHEPSTSATQTTSAAQVIDTQGFFGSFCHRSEPVIPRPISQDRTALPTGLRFGKSEDAMTKAKTVSATEVGAAMHITARRAFCTGRSRSDPALNRS